MPNHQIVFVANQHRQSLEPLEQMIDMDTHEETAFYLMCVYGLRQLITTSNLPHLRAFEQQGQMLLERPLKRSKVPTTGQ